MPNQLLWPIAKNVGKQIAKNVIFPKSLNKNEDLVVDEMSDPNSPMNKNIYQWTDEDFNKAWYLRHLIDIIRLYKIK